jgi:predicted SAM-dependent methyltransferase/glycosyltransferase involved in cell wall biosynthesis
VSASSSADLHIMWNGRRYDGRKPALYCEHGWLPRSAFQISPKGINACSHIAPFHWDGEPLPAYATAELDAHFASVRSAVLAEEPKGPEVVAPSDFLLVPLQMEFDTNIVWHAPAELQTMQSLVDYVTLLAPLWPVVFKQHPSDARRANQHLGLVMRRTQDRLWPHSKGTIHSLLRDPGCRGILTINSNVAHDGLLWDVPAIVLGRNVWPSAGPLAPFLTSAPTAWAEFRESMLAPQVVQCRRAYASFLVRNQWTLAKARDPEQVERLLRSALEYTPAARQRASRPPLPGLARSKAPLSSKAAAARRSMPSVSTPVVNVVAEDRGWLFEVWKRQFLTVARHDLELVVSEKPVRQADAWTFIRAREADRSPDPARTVVQIHDWYNAGAYAERGERAGVRECAALCLTHPEQRTLLASAGIATERRAFAVQPVGFMPCTTNAMGSKSGPTVAWVGRPAAHAGEDLSRLDFFAAAAASLGKGIQVALIGERLTDAERRLKAAGVDCSIRDGSRYPLDQCGRWIREFDCVAITSETDSGPWPLFDALHAGVPVVSRPVGWARDLLADGRCGRAVDDPVAMSEAISQILAARTQWAESRAELSEVVAKFSVNAWIDVNLSLAMQLISGRTRDAPTRAATVDAGVGMRLDVGCGEKPRSGHVGVDVRAVPGVSLVCNSWELDKHVAAGTVEAIYSRHFFEHLTFEQGRATLRAFRRVLRPNGSVHLIVPDARYHAQQLLSGGDRDHSEANHRWTNRQHAFASLWGWQRDGFTELWDVHKAGYDETALRDALRAAGFSRIERLPDRPWNLSVSAVAE